MLRRWAMSAVFVLVSLLLASVAAQAEISWVDIPLGDGGSVRAAYGAVGQEPGPAVIFNHGTGVRRMGHDGAVSGGNMDVTDYVRALNAMGYTAIAPIRTKHRDTAYVQRGSATGSTREWIEVIEHGMEVAASARAFLVQQPSVDADRIAIIGFSEGGLVTLWAAGSQPGYRAVVLLAPATVRDAKQRSMRRAAGRQNLSGIDAPVYLAVASNDNRSIRQATRKRLIPTMEELGKVLSYKLDYGGDHKGFYDPSEELLNDIKAFLLKHL